ncbi:RNA polymerase sigma factor [Sulfidibacter corallicola]|uniref:RNA polymerase sigma factor n=1 Tax=Sulfidibacter corallicola TaxID=2818388 RepID=A0A8A4TZ00_SULCO|nr:sigma-70 family RNA polymerase sigma factor [Sulfidibacter corallicola]QTD54324.1 sigma-70 family RNA polymerase sigma factor [Sulfidibacter corallicola]
MLKESPDDPGGVSRLVDHLFRQQAGQMVSTLARVFGSEHLDLAEDVVQEAMLKAMRQWPFCGVPDNPAAWLVTVAKNRALDLLRRKTVFRGKREAIEATLLEWHGETKGRGPDVGGTRFDRELRDDQLRMIFTCCHPDIPHQSRVALTLKTAGGFSVSEIARAFLCNQGTIAQRLVRAKRRIREKGIAVTMPLPSELESRLDTVLSVLYLMFNEGHSPHEGSVVIRADLCHEAIRLASLLADHPVTMRPKVHALTALFLFQAARLPARADAHGGLLLLSEQDRSCWDRALIARALHHFERSAFGDELTAFHLEAEIASCHTLAIDSARTDWPRITMLYDMLLKIRPDPIVALNRAVALAEAKGAEEALAALDELAGHSALASYYPYHAACGEMLRRLGMGEAAADAFLKAQSLCSSEPVRVFLQRRAEEARTR